MGGTGGGYSTRLGGKGTNLPADLTNRRHASGSSMGIHANGSPAIREEMQAVTVRAALPLEVE